MRTLSFVLFVLWANASTVWAGALPVASPLDPAAGVIDGKTAVAVFPATFQDNHALAILDSVGLEVHMTPWNDPQRELVVPAGAWFLPLRQRSRAWLEGEDLMSPYSVALDGGGPFQGRGQTTLLGLVAAGRVVLPAGFAATSGSVFWCLRAQAHREGDLARWELSRQSPVEQAGNGSRMPAGRVIAAVWNERRREYTALSRPFDVRPGAVVAAPLEQPAEKAHLVVVLERYESASTIDDYDVEWQLRRRAGVLPPAVIVPTATKVYAFWYDLAPGPAELRAGSPEHSFAPLNVHLHAGAIGRLDAALTPKPSLDVAVDLPAPLHGKTSILELRDSGGNLVARQSLRDDATGRRFVRLPFERLTVELQTSVGDFTEEVDLTSGGDTYVLLKPELTVLSGRVYRGDEGHPAELSFHTVARTTVKTTADELGDYEVLLVKPMRGVSIELEGVEAEPFVDFFPQAIRGEQRLDFHLPDAEYKVRVIDATTGLGIAEAMVVTRNEYHVGIGGKEDEDDEDSKPTKAVNQETVTDDEGIAVLSPLHQGELEVRASAEGYRELLEPIRVDILDGETDQTVEVALEPVGETVTLRLRLPTGEPAVGAEAILVENLATGLVFFSARADAAGEMRAPLRPPAGVLLARHPDTAFLVRAWQPHEGESEIDRTLPAAGASLSIRVKDKWGENAAPRAELAVWIDGWRLSGSTLTWLTGRHPATDAFGAWNAVNFPQTAVTILAWIPGTREQATAGGLDGLATDIAFPWPNPIEILAVQ